MRSRKLVTWKDEGGGGPVSIFNADERQLNGLPKLAGRPYDPARPPPEWHTRESAQALADAIDADFMEW